MLIFLAAAAQSSGASVDTAYYILASIALVGGFVIGGWRLLIRQRRKWTDEGAVSAEANRATRENNARLQANTDAIARLTETQTKLSVQMADFMTGVHSELSGLGKRVSRLEFHSHRRDDLQGSLW